MTYTDIAELPSEVRNSYDADDMQVWMECYNELAGTMSVQDAYRQAFRQCMTLPSSFSFKIIASVEDVDSDGELITIDTLNENMDSFINEGGKVQQAHSNYQIATIWDYEDYTDPDTGKPGIVVYGNVFGGDGSNLEYTRARQDFLDGQNSLSIGADASVEGYECTDDQCYVRRNILELMEISLCKTPANPYAKLVWYNDNAIIKSAEDTTLKVASVDVHKSYDECSYEKVGKMLAKAGIKGYSVHKDGCHVPSSDAYDANIRKVMDSLHLRYDYDTVSKEFIVRSVEDEMERVFKRGLKEGWLTNEDGDYRVQDSIPMTYFVDCVRKGYVRNKDDAWYLNGSILKDCGAMTASNAGSDGAFNPRYSSKDRIPFEELMGWQKRVRKKNVEAVSRNGDYYGYFDNVGDARTWAMDVLTNEPSQRYVSLYDSSNSIFETIYIDEEFDEQSSLWDQSWAGREDQFDYRPFGAKMQGYVWNRRLSEVKKIDTSRKSMKMKRARKSIERRNIEVDLMEAFDSYLNHNGIEIEEYAFKAENEEEFDMMMDRILDDFQNRVSEYIDVRTYLEGVFRYDDFIYKTKKGGNDVYVQVFNAGTDWEQYVMFYDIYGDDANPYQREITDGDVPIKSFDSRESAERYAVKHGYNITGYR